MASGRGIDNNTRSRSANCRERKKEMTMGDDGASGTE